MSKKLLTQPEIEIRKLKAPHFIEKWAFIPLYALTFCEIFVNLLDSYLLGVRNKKERMSLTFSLLMKI